MRSIDTVAVLSDIHGVLPVLEAVLMEPDVVAADLIVVTGDIAAGPMPNETLDLLIGLGSRCLLVRGNGDRELVETRRGVPSTHAETVWAANELRDDHVALLARLPHPVTLEVRGFGEVLFCHGTPESDVDVVLVDTRVDRWLAALDAVPDAVRTVVCGHTHTPYLRYVGGRVVVNAGSIGMPYGRPGGAWVLLRNGQIEMRHTSVDVDAVCERIVAESAYPDRVTWVDEYVRARNSDVDALRAFAPLDGRRDPPAADGAANPG
jgi:predicted phosphodiesterase